LKPLILLAVLNCLAENSRSFHPMAQKNVKNAQFSRVFAEFLCDDCDLPGSIQNQQFAQMPAIVIFLCDMHPFSKVLDF
jgi:hypothetical protein